MLDEHASLAKHSALSSAARRSLCARAARRQRHPAREHIGRFVADAERSTPTRHQEMNTLIVGKSITGLSASSNATQTGFPSGAASRT